MDYNSSVGERGRIALPATLGELQALTQTSLSRSIDAADKATLLSETTRGSYNFIEAVPLENLATTMKPQHFVLEVKRRLLMDLQEEDDWCPLCDMISHCRGRHDPM